jgi:hypothetical protein
MTSATRQNVIWSLHQDSLTGRLDSTQHTVQDSSRGSASDRWAETEAGVAWEGGRLSAAFTLGGRLASRGIPAATWAAGDLAVRLTRPVSLVLGAGSAAGSGFALDAEHRFFSLGFRLTPVLRRERVVEHPLTTSPAFAVAAVGAGRYRLTLTAPSAHRVEVSGDFTAWKPVPLLRGPDGQWILLAALTEGTHRLNVRVDNGDWVAPPGLTTMSDDFAGEVGVLVIERAPATK